MVMKEMKWFSSAMLDVLADANNLGFGLMALIAKICLTFGQRQCAKSL
jgi:hypothetical protein